MKDSNGKVIIRLDVEFFDRLFKCPDVEEYVDISIESTQNIMIRIQISARGA